MMSLCHKHEPPNIQMQRTGLYIMLLGIRNPPTSDLGRSKDANSRSRRGYAERGVQEFTCHQPSSGKGNFVSSSFHGRNLVLTSMSVILMVRRILDQPGR
jgi:hypothetical protein